jgi:hypothetical protein
VVAGKDYVDLLERNRSSPETKEEEGCVLCPFKRERNTYRLNVGGLQGGTHVSLQWCDALSMLENSEP